jgi:hypothetical protein
MEWQKWDPDGPSQNLEPQGLISKVLKNNDL